MARKIRPRRAVPTRGDIVSKLGTGRILVDPDLLPESGTAELSVLPLLFNRLLLPNPDPARIQRWGISQSWLSALAAEEIVVPIAVGETLLEDFPADSQVTRAEVLPNEEFYALYQRAVAADVEDPDFDLVVDDIRRGMAHRLSKDSIAFDANWDFLLSLRLNAPVASHVATRSLWRYKLASLGGLREPNAPSLEESAQDLFSFLTEYTLRLPSSLTIDELRALRNEPVARKFRTWFYEALSRARRRSSVTAIAVDELLLRDFSELMDSHTSHIERGAEIMTAVVMAGVSLIAGLAEGTGSAVTYPVFRQLAGKATARWGSQRWIEVLAGLKSHDGGS